MLVTVKSNENPWVNFIMIPRGTVVRMRTASTGEIVEGHFMAISFEGSHSSTPSVVDLGTGKVVQHHIINASQFQAVKTVELVVSY